MQKFISLVASLGVVACVGCDELAAPPPKAVPAMTDQSASKEASPIDEPSWDDSDSSADDQYEREVAEAGIGKKGRNYGGGVITEPIKQYFQASQRINLLNMKHAIDIYKATHDRLPRTHDEFMKEIIQANSIELPELPEGERYVYDPESGELMVERPKP